MNKLDFKRGSCVLFNITPHFIEKDCLGSHILAVYNLLAFYLLEPGLPYLKYRR